MKQWGRLCFAMFAIMAVVLLPGCGGGGGGSSRGTVTDAAAGVRISGKLVDDAGSAVSGAMVTDGNISVTTASDGSFTVPVGFISERGVEVKLTVQRAGHLDAFKTIALNSDNVVNNVHTVTVKMQRLPRTADEATAAQVTAANGSSQDIAATAVIKDGITVYETRVTLAGDERAVTFSTPPSEAGAQPEASIQFGDPSGAGISPSAMLGVTGDIIGSVSYGDPTDATDLETFPGEFIVRENGVEQALITAGFARINLTKGDGTPITQFALGQTAKITMTIPAETVNPETGMLMAPGDTIPVFVFNEATGEWIVERNSDNSVKRTTVQQNNDGTLFTEFETSHLSTFNLDFFGGWCSEWGETNSDTPIIKVVDGSGNALNGATLKFGSPSGWSHSPYTAPDNIITLWRAPKTISWQVWAEKNRLTSRVATVTSCKDVSTGGSEITLTIGEPPAAACGSDTDCDDGNALTMDRCRNAGQAAAYCSHIACASSCTSDAACDDGNTNTQDTCANPGTCQAYCSHTACSAACAADADCEDGDADTLDTCLLAGTCNAVCSFPDVYCDLSLDKVNYVPGDEMIITLTARNDGPVSANCGAAAALKREIENIVWNSFDEDLYITILPGQSVTRTITKIVPDLWPGTDTSEGSDFAMFTVHEDGMRWDQGDNFNIHLSKACDVACSSDAPCDDGNPITVDTCQSPGSCASACSNAACSIACSSDAQCDDGSALTTDTCQGAETCDAACSNAACSVACSNDAQCDDGNTLTADVCNNPGACAASCSSSACTPACTASAQCDDANALTIDTCLSPNTCAAACFSTPCTITCSGDADCNDGNALTTDTCGSPGTCGASCMNTPFTPDCTIDADCNDGNAATADICTNPGLVIAACVNAGVTASAAPTALTLSGGQAQSTLTCTTAGTITQLQGRCDTTDSWSTIASGVTMNCTYASKAVFTPGCLVNGLVSDDVNTPVTVSNAPPSVSISATPTFSAVFPVDVSFTATCTDTDGTCSTYEWSFGDGSPADNAQNPLHTFTAPGSYAITLVVTDNDGASATGTATFSGSNTWSRTFGGIVNEGAYAALQTADGGFAATGYTDSIGAGNFDFFFTKVDAAGNLLIGNPYGGAGRDVANDIIQTSDGGYVIAGYTSSKGAGGFDAWIVKIAADGTLEWDNTYGGINDEDAYSIRQTNDGGYIVAGYSQSFGAGDKDAWALRLSPTGTTIWQGTFGVAFSDENAYAIRETSSGGYILTGDAAPPTGNILTIKLNSFGNVLWQQTATFGDGASGYSVEELSGGGYLVGGYYIDPGTSNNSAIAIRYSSNGMLLWMSTYDAGLDEHGYSIKELSDGAFILAGDTNSSGNGGYDGFLIKFDALGMVLWAKTLGGADTDKLFSISETSDLGLIVAGYVQASDFQLWIAKLNQDGDCIDATCP